MSTAELFMPPDEVEDFIRESLESDALTVFGEGSKEIGLCPFISFYIYNRPDEFVPLAENFVHIFDKFESDIIDEPFQLFWHGQNQGWMKCSDPRLQHLQNYILTAQRDGREVWIRATDMTSPGDSARWAFSCAVDNGLGHSYTQLKLTLRRKWHRRNPAKWKAFVHECLRTLCPDQCYSGYEVGNGGFNIVGAYECDVLERICADHFYGMDIDHPTRMGFHSFNREDSFVDHVSLAAGIRTPTWSFLLSPFWLEKLGKTEADIRGELSDPHIEITSIPYGSSPINPQGRHGLWIQAGELDLHPVDRGVPDLLVQVNKTIRPIRCDQLQLLTLDPWDDDPNPRFDFESSLRWMRRFDEDGGWPDAPKQGHG